MNYMVTAVSITPDERRFKEWRGRRSAENKEKTRLEQQKYRGGYGVSTEASKRSQHKKKVRAFMLLGGMCVWCNDNRMQVLELDHKNNNGSEERKTIGRCGAMIKEVFKRPNDFQLLCGSCHNLKNFGVQEIDKEWRS